MKTISFVYKDKMYEGNLRISTVKEPYFYWYHLNDTDLNKEIGQCILFIGEKGVLKTPHYYPPEQRVLIECLKDSIVKHTATALN